MVYDSPWLETIGYALSILFLQQLIEGNEDIFLICPQFPLYVSPGDKDPGPDVTMPDSRAKGVYVDQVLLLPRASQTEGDLKLSQAFGHNQRNLSLHHSLHISILEVPLLEKKKRAPTRHPLDLEAHVRSIQAALDDAQSQVVTQAKILFSSPRFATQDLVILVASSGEYYRLAVLSRGHRALSVIPSAFDVFTLIMDEEETPEFSDVVEDLKSQLVLSARTPTEREQQRLFAQCKAEKEEKVKQKDAREARAAARSERQAALRTQEGLMRKLSQIVIDAGEPEPTYSDDWIEAYHGINRVIDDDVSFKRYPNFFEPEPHPHETVSTLATLRNPNSDREIVFTGVIRIGSQTSEKFLKMIRQYLSRLAGEERSRRQSII
jgi:hypothetical protein